MDLNPVFTRAHQLVQAGWFQGGYSNSNASHKTLFDEDATRFCVYGACYRAMGEALNLTDLNAILETELLEAVNKKLVEAGISSGWNDSPTTTKDDVLNRLGALIQ